MYLIPNDLTDIVKTLGLELNNFPIFVETGTHIGETIFNMEPLFKQLYTIEIKKAYYDLVVNQYSGNKIEFILGDSMTQLQDIINKISENTIFFLDGHYSAGTTGRGSKDVPLLEELQQIMETYSREGIIIVDDAPMFGTTCYQDWSLITKENIINICKNRLIKYFTVPVGDRFILHISSN